MVSSHSSTLEKKNDGSPDSTDVGWQPDHSQVEAFDRTRVRAFIRKVERRVVGIAE
jgi:hypothetical protein